MCLRVELSKALWEKLAVLEGIVCDLWIVLDDLLTGLGVNGANMHTISLVAEVHLFTEK